MRVGILGSGDVGQTLGAGFTAQGHEVKRGTRNPGQQKIRDWLAKVGPGATAGTFAQAAAHGEVVEISVLGARVEQVIGLAGSVNVAGRVVIDTTNPLDFAGADFARGVPPRLFVDGTDALGERVQRLLCRRRGWSRP